MAIHPAAPGESTDVTQAVDDLARRYGAAAGALDVEAFLALYDDDVVVHDLVSAEPLVGLTVWRGQVTSWFGEVGPDDRNVAEVDPMTVHASGGFATAFGRVRYAMVGPDGAERYGMWNRLTWVVRQGDDGGWRILHEHTSVSLDPATSEPQLGV